jgi:hypothetical protein
VVGRRRDADLHLVLDGERPEPIGVHLHAVQLAAAVEVRQLQRVEPALPLAAAQRVVAHDPPERRPLVWDVGRHRHLRHPELALVHAVELAERRPLAADERAQLVEHVVRERVRPGDGGGLADEPQRAFEIGAAQPHGTPTLCPPRRADNTTIYEWTGGARDGIVGP